MGRMILTKKHIRVIFETDDGVRIHMKDDIVVASTMSFDDAVRGMTSTADYIIADPDHNRKQADAADRIPYRRGTRYPDLSV